MIVWSESLCRNESGNVAAISLQLEILQIQAHVFTLYFLSRNIGWRYIIYVRSSLYCAVQVEAKDKTWSKDCKNLRNYAWNPPVHFGHWQCHYSSIICVSVHKEQEYFANSISLNFGKDRTLARTEGQDPYISTRAIPTYRNQNHYAI